VELRFAARNHPGRIIVDVRRSEDPGAIGFPICTATVTSAGDGYDAFFGWVQLVGEGDPPVFANDPLRIYEDLDTPFGFFGYKPTLFDAPMRRNRDQHLEWLAHSFLCVSPSDPMEREVKAVVGFSWGFVLDHGDITLIEPRPLADDDWNAHLEHLRGQFPTWAFVSLQAR